MKKMKNMKMIGLVFFAAVLFITALNAGASEEEIFEIRERMFIQQSYDIYFNTDEYLGKTVRLEGIYSEFPGGGDREPQPYVYRNAPGCCGDDGMVGFIVLLDECPAPESNAWVEATGKIEITGEGEVVLRLSSLKVMEQRGKEFVSD